MPRRIAYLLEFATIAGGERSLLAFLGGLDRDRFTPVVVAPRREPLASALTALDVEHVASLEDAGACDLIHANSLTVGHRLGSNPPLGVPTVSHIRDIMRLGAARRRGLAHHRALIAVSEATAANLVAEGLDRERIHVIRNGIRIDAPDRDRARQRLRTELAIAPDTALIANVGQICLRKAQDDFLAAARRVATRRANVHFVIVGERFSRKDESIAFERALHAAAEREPLAGRCHFLGWRDDAIDIIAASDVLAHTAHQEPLGRVLLEALALGTPIVATDVGGTREIIEHDNEGLIVPDGDVDSITRAIERLLPDGGCNATRSPTAERLAATGRDKARTTFSVERMCIDIMSLYDSILGST